MTGVPFLAGTENFSFCYYVQTRSGEHPTSCLVDGGVSCPGGVAIVCKADRSPTPSADVKSAWNYIPTPPYIFMAWCFVKYRIHLHVWYLVKHRDSCTFAFTFTFNGFMKPQ